MQAVIVIESRTNKSGIEVRVARDERGATTLQAYRLGALVAERGVTRTDGMQLGQTARFLDECLSHDDRAELSRALDEGVRVLRDGRGLGEAA